MNVQYMDKLLLCCYSGLPQWNRSKVNQFLHVSTATTLLFLQTWEWLFYPTTTTVSIITSTQLLSLLLCGALLITTILQDKRLRWTHFDKVFTVCICLLTRINPTTPRLELLLLGPLLSIRYINQSPLYLVTSYTMQCVLHWTSIMTHNSAQSSSSPYIAVYHRSILSIAAVQAFFLLLICKYQDVYHESKRRERRSPSFRRDKSLPFALWSIDTQGNITFGAGASKFIKEPSKQENLSNLYSRATYRTSPEVMERIIRSHRTVLETGTAVVFEFEGTMEDTKEMFYYISTLMPLRDERTNQISGALGISVETTQLVKEKKNLQTMNARYRHVLECISDRIIAVDKELNIRLVNQESLLGIPRDSLLGSSILELFKNCEHTRRQLEQALYAVFNQSQQEETLEFIVDLTSREPLDAASLGSKLLRQRLMDGSIAFYMVTISPLRETTQRKNDFGIKTEDQVIRAIISMRDLTASKRAVEQERENEEIRVAFRSKSEFIQQVSHELRNPLAMIMGNLELLLSSGNFHHVEREIISNCYTSSTLLREICDQVLEMELIEQGKIFLNETENNILDVVEYIAETHATTAANYDLELLTSIDTRLPLALQLDKSNIARIGSNLLSNSIKFTPPGGQIRLSAHLMEETDDTVVVQLVCSDTGIGIEKEHIPHMFDMYMQCESPNIPCTEFRGFGIGLPVVKSLVAMMHGSVNVQSELDKGTTISITLPLRKVQSDQRQADSPIDTPVWSRIRDRLLESDFETVITVCRDESLAQVMHQYLSDLQVKNIRCHISSSICAGIPIELESFSSEFEQWICGKTAIIIDYNIHDKDSLRHLQGIASRVQMCAVLLTRQQSLHSMEEIIDEAERLSLRPLMKPVRLFQLMEILRADKGHRKSVRSNPLSSQEVPSAKMPVFRSILVVEDSAVLQRIMTKFLEKLGYERIIVASNGREAVDIIENAGPNEIGIVLMDLYMPTMDGWQAAQAIRSIPDPSKSNLPIVAVTACGNQEALERCKTIGFNDFIPKPCTIQILSNVIERTLRSSPFVGTK